MRPEARAAGTPALLALLLLGCAGPPRAGGARVLLFPIQNLSQAPEASAAGPVLAEALAGRGLEVVPPARIEEFLRRERIRHVDSLEEGRARSLAAEHGAAGILFPAVYEFRAGARPAAALGLRVLSAETGRTTWIGLRSAVSPPRSTLLGPKVARDPLEVARLAARELVEEMPLPGGAAGSSARLPALLLPRPLFFRRQDFRFDPEAGTALLPFENRSTTPGAGRIVAEVFRGALQRSLGARVPEASELLAGMVRQRIRSIAFLDPEAMARVAGEARVGHFLVGTVEVFEVHEGAPEGPEVELSVRLVEPGSGVVPWVARHRRRGSDYHLLLGSGQIDSPTALAERMAEEMVATIPAR